MSRERDFGGELGNNLPDRDLTNCGSGTIIFVAMIWKKRMGVWACLLALGLSCGQKKEPPIKNAPAAEPSQLRSRLERVELRWEILQKDNPPQVETTNFRMTLADAKKALAEKNYAAAGSKIQECEGWLDQVSNRYYVTHLEGLKQGLVQEDPKTLWEAAEKLWTQEADYFTAHNQEYAELDGQAGYEQGEAAAFAAIASDLPTREKVAYCLKLADKEDQISDKAGAEQWRKEAKQLLEKRIQLLADQINWCLSGTVPVCELVSVRQNSANYAQAKKVLDDSESEISDLVKWGNSVFPNSFIPPNLSARIQAWSAEQENFLLSAGKSKEPGFQDFQTLKEQERREQKELLNKYNQLYCPNGEELSNFGLSLEKTDVKKEGKNLVFRMRLTNNRNDAIYKPRLRLCGGVVSDEVDLGYERYPGNYSASFSVTVLGIDAEEVSSGQVVIPSHRALLTFEDSKGKTHQAQQIFNP